MPIEQLRPIAPDRPPPTPKCDALIPNSVPGNHEYAWRRERYGQREPNRNPDKCQHLSVVRIGPFCYCKKHAGQIALRLWLEGKLVEKVDDR